MTLSEGKDMELGEWYFGQTVLITGGTGFLGKAVIEKLLRTTKIKRIYLLIRAKKGKDIQTRTQEFLQDSIFDKINSSSKDLVSAVEGDVSLEGLGLSDSDKLIIKNQVTVVIHGAATIKFDEQLKLAVDINVKGTKHVLDLSREIQHINAVVHISTAFTYFTEGELQETFYDAPISGDSLIQMVDNSNNTHMETKPPKNFESWPNNYVFTKAVGEGLIKDCGTGLPLAVFRPAIVIGSKDEPEKGWFGGKFGVLTAVVAMCCGILRCAVIDKTIRAELVPVDLCANAILAIVRHTAKKRFPCTTIFNFSPSKQNPITWTQYLQLNIGQAKLLPSIHSVWYPTMILTSNLYVYSIYNLLYNYVPVIIIDTFLLGFTKKPRALKLLNKVLSFLKTVEIYCLRNCNMHNTNIRRLFNDMSEDDKILFNFNMDTIDWKDYVKDNYCGIKRYILKENLNNIKSARIKMFCLMVLHKVLITSFYMLVFLLIWKCKAGAVLYWLF